MATSVSPGDDWDRLHEGNRKAPGKGSAGRYGQVPRSPSRGGHRLGSRNWWSRKAGPGEIWTSRKAQGTKGERWQRKIPQSEASSTTPWIPPGTREEEGWKPIPGAKEERKGSKEKEEEERKEKELHFGVFIWPRTVKFFWVAFSENLSPGRGFGATSRKEARAIDRDGAQRDGKVSGRPHRGAVGEGFVGSHQSFGLPEPDHPHEQPSFAHRREGAPRAGDGVHLLRPASSRRKPALPGRADAASEGARGVGDRRPLGPREALRADPARSSADLQGERKRDGSKDRSKDAEAKRGQPEDAEAAEIGNRQRVSKGHRETRESASEPREKFSKRERAREEPKRKEQQPSPSPIRGTEKGRRELRRRGKKERFEEPPREASRRVVLSKPSPSQSKERPSSSGRTKGPKRGHPEPEDPLRGSGQKETGRPEGKRRRQAQRKELVEFPKEEETQEELESERLRLKSPLKDVAQFVDKADEQAEDFRRWLEEEPPSNLSAAQLGFHLLLQSVRSSGPLSDYVCWSMQPPEKRESRDRSLFPLPLWKDCREEARKVLDQGTAKDRPGQWRERGDTRSSAQKQKRLEGLRVWHALVVMSLNFTYGDRARQERPSPGGDASAAQEAALNRLWDSLKIYIDEKDKKGVPRTPLEEWRNTIADLSISYTGEVVEKAALLSLKQVLPGLPSPDHGGLVDILEILPPDLGEQLKDPEKLIKDDFPDPMPRPKVMCEDAEWDLVVKAMYERGLVRAATQMPSVHGKMVVNGAFGVPKAGKTLPSGEDVLRLIIDLRATNWMMHQIEGDATTLSGAATFQRIVVEEGSQLLVSGEDLTSAFYLFRLPEVWSNFMVLDKPVPKTIVGLEGPGLVHVGLAVLPMGWHSSVGLMQAGHRRLALGSPLNGGAGLSSLAEITKASSFPDLDEGPGWAIYLDDTTIIEKVQEKIAKELEGKEPELQERLKKAYQWWGIPTNEGKSLKRQAVAERLGAVLDGKAGVLRASALRKLQISSLGAWIRSQRAVSRKALQIYCGKLVHILQFRRCLFAYLETVFTAIAQGGPSINVTEELRQEMIAVEMVLPMAQYNLRAKVDTVVTASDACESGGGICVASRLSREGKAEVERMLEGEKLEREPIPDPTMLNPKEKVIVIDLFSGIGGLTNALEKAGVQWDFLVCVESDKDCRRLLRRVHPGAEMLKDIRDFDEKFLRRILAKVPGVTGIIIGGGSPCQGLSKLSSKRKHLQDERSGLFFEAARAFRLVERASHERLMWCLKLLENVVPDSKDIQDMSYELEMEPVLVDAQYLSRARRPRLFWLSTKLSEEEDVEMIERPHFTQVIYRAEPEPMELFLEAGHDWAGGMRDANLKFPTFTRSIPRKQPPPDPAGLEGLPEAAKIRWEEASFRLPPYTYHDDYMILTPDLELRPLASGEREILMGFPQGHVQKMLKKTPEGEKEKQAAEDLMVSAIGNSFHTNAVAALLDHALASMGLKKRKGAKEIVAGSRAMQVMPPKKGAEAEESEGEGPNETEMLETMSIPGNEYLEKLEKETRSKALASELRSDDHLSQLLVSAFVRRQEYRGSDVRLDIGSLYRPDSFPRGSVNPNKWIWHTAHHWPFKREEHINLLELRALIHTFEWRLRKSAFGDCRPLHLTDSQVALSVSVKGRSSSRRLNNLLKKFAVLQVGGGIFPLLAWVESEANPADAPSRIYEKKK